MKKRELWTLGLLALVFLCLMLLLAGGCTTMPASPSSGVAAKPSPTPGPETPKASPAPADSQSGTSQTQPADTQAAEVAQITELARTSSCAAHYWKDRGYAPKAFVEGLSLVYARAVCSPNRSDVRVVSRPISSDTVHDALAWYGFPQGDSLLQTYTLMLGLGMQESSGRFCCGRDMSAKFDSADSAEAGLFQASWGARRVSSELVNLYSVYATAQRSCFSSVFKAGLSCSEGNLKNWGDPTSAGYHWQALTKSCPAFSAEYAALLVRNLGGSYGEFGPLRHKYAEYRPECESMLEKVKELVHKKPEICGLL